MLVHEAEFRHENFSYVRATSVKEAVQQASTNNNAMFIAGGTLVDRMKVFETNLPTD